MPRRVRGRLDARSGYPTFEPGDLCSIWDGQGPIQDPSSWPIGIVVRVARGDARPEIRRYQVLWPDGLDEMCYSGRDIDPRKRPDDSSTERDSA